jgi:RNA polymerase-binding transcription factor DksA
MDQASLERHRRQLIDLGRRLQTEFSGISEEALRTTGGQAAGNLSNAPLHLADVGTEEYAEEVNISLLENRGQLLEEVNAALDRINQGTYGRCEVCGKQIAEERLRAIPYTRLCIDDARAGKQSESDETT